MITTNRALAIPTPTAAEYAEAVEYACKAIENIPEELYCVRQNKYAAALEWALDPDGDQYAGWYLDGFTNIKNWCLTNEYSNNLNGRPCTIIFKFGDYTLSIIGAHKHVFITDVTPQFVYFRYSEKGPANVSTRIELSKVLAFIEEGE